MSHEIAFWILFVIALAVLASINAKLDSLHKKLDRVLSCFDGLREYLYEIDPQFDEERAAEGAMADESDTFGGYGHCMLLKQKNAEDRRTLNTPFFDPDGA